MTWEDCNASYLIFTWAVGYFYSVHTGRDEVINWGLLGPMLRASEYNGIFVKLIIMSVTTNWIGKSNGKKKGIH